MRLWHKDLIPVLPRQQLIGQWRECCLIAKNIAEKGSPNHLLINKIMDYPEDEFNTYAYAVYKEITRRGYTIDQWKFFKWRNDLNVIQCSVIFKGWHTDRYFWQCYYNLQEKYDRGGIIDKEWEKIENLACRQSFAKWRN